MVAGLAAAEDRKTHLLRNVLTGPLAAIAVVGFLIAGTVGGETIEVIDLVAGAVIFAGPWLVSFLISPKSIGFGDVKYAAGLGLYLGRLGATVALNGLLFACVIGGVAAIFVLRSRPKNEPFAFGPALLGGAGLATALSLLAS